MAEDVDLAETAVAAASEALWRGEPIAAARELVGIISHAEGRQKRWGRVKLLGMRALALWLSQHKRHPGRPKSPAAGVLPPSLAELGISSQLASRLDPLANIPAPIFDHYIERAEEPGYGECMAFAEMAAANSAATLAAFRGPAYPKIAG